MSNLDLDCLHALERKVLWLSTQIIHNANHERDNEDGLKVGGHQASSASLVSIRPVNQAFVSRGPNGSSGKSPSARSCHRER